jgi:hypothetical protein
MRCTVETKFLQIDGEIVQIAGCFMIFDFCTASKRFDWLKRFELCGACLLEVDFHVQNITETNHSISFVEWIV